MYIPVPAVSVQNGKELNSIELWEHIFECWSEVVGLFDGLVEVFQVQA